MEFLDLWHDYFSSRVIGAVGSALPSHGRGRGFESRITHREKGLVPAQFARELDRDLAVGSQDRLHSPASPCFASVTVVGDTRLELMTSSV